MLPFDLPPPIPIVSQAPELIRALPQLIAKETPAKVSMHEQAFNRAVSKFQQHLAKLPPKHKAEIRKIHTRVTKWADKARSDGQRADKLSTFVGEVMTYADKHLANIEKADPELKQLKAEHQQFQDLFMAGNGVIEAYLAWVNTDYKKPKKKGKSK